MLARVAWSDASLAARGGIGKPAGYDTRTSLENPFRNLLHIGITVFYRIFIAPRFADTQQQSVRLGIGGQQLRLRN
jgi:hypothetical protein